jgi:hypothetical protein
MVVRVARGVAFKQVPCLMDDGGLDAALNNHNSIIGSDALQCLGKPINGPSTALHNHVALRVKVQ